MTEDYYFMEMCLAWRLPPHEVEAYPRNVQVRMLRHFHWHNVRANQHAEIQRRRREAQAQAAREGRR